MTAAEGPGKAGRGEDPHQPPLRSRMQRVLLLAAGAAYALAAATTTAFSRPADVVTALPIVVLAVLVVVRWPLRPHVPVLATETSHPWRAWVVLFLAILAWELAEYAARGSRATHPTLSSMLDAVDRQYVLKALVFFLWLCLGAAIVRKGRPGHPQPRPGPS